jgi:2-C-methyl-D-erythritol 4-phosphate cytidylyltransferase/2-C-methyl-D-erythritol 2,4-cyclodiphosphate synthase
LIATSAVIPASGLGRRLNSDRGKAFTDIGGMPLIARTIAVFQNSPAIDEIVLIAQSDRIEDARALADQFGFSKVASIVPGGEVRQDSVRNGIAAVSKSSDIIAIHDGARPFVTPEIIQASIDAACEDSAAIVAVPVIDTIKSSSTNPLARSLAGLSTVSSAKVGDGREGNPDRRFVGSTLDREKLWAIQTPQTFRRDVILTAFERAYADGFVGTDDASLVERMGIPVRIVQGSYENIKITTPTDLRLAEAIMESRGTSRERVSRPLTRIGHGYDVHRFAPGRKLILGGVEFPGEDGLLGHSDADVLLHAIADALLGAVGEGDIGVQFPNTSPEFKDADSMELLARTGKIVADSGWLIGNIDVTLVAERPKISPHVPDIRRNIASALQIEPAQVGVKATTREGLGAIGESLGAECHAVALVCRT